jgi:hypothetical protein
MKKQTRILPFVLMLSWIGLNSSCASLGPPSPPALENRTLRLSLEVPGFEYQFEECVKKVVGICVKKQMKKETFDLRDPLVRQRLIDMGFVARVRERQ